MSLRVIFSGTYQGLLSTFFYLNFIACSTFRGEELKNNKIIKNNKLKQHLDYKGVKSQTLMIFFFPVIFRASM